MIVILLFGSGCGQKQSVARCTPLPKLSVFVDTNTTMPKLELKVSTIDKKVCMSRDNFLALDVYIKDLKNRFSVASGQNRLYKEQIKEFNKLSDNRCKEQ
jgi:hypothetical protein